MTAPVLPTHALAEAYRVGQAKIAADAAAAVGLAHKTMLTKSDLGKGFEHYVVVASKVINAARQNAAALGGGFYLAHRNASGVLGAMPEIAWAPLINPAQLHTSLLVTGPVAVKRALSMGSTIEQALKSAEVRTMGAAYRHTANGGRATIKGTILRDEAAIGWARVSDGRPCAFCAMLCSRGAVYESATTAGVSEDGDKYHDNCGCFVVPVYTRNDPIPGLGPELATLWEQTQKDKAAGVSAFSAWRKAYGAKYPEGTNPSAAIAQAQLGAAKAEAAGNRAAYEAKLAEEAAKAQAEAEAAAKAAEEAAREAERIAAEEARKAAEEAAKAAAEKAAKKEAAKVKKWLGKPKPKPPAKPEPPRVDEKRFFDPWLAKVTARYDALGTGKKLSASFNYSYVTEVIEQRSITALDYLKANKYVDDVLYQEALDTIAQVAAAKTNAVTDADYLKALKSYRNLSTRYKRYIAEWREVNGVTAASLNGLAGALRHANYEEADSWWKAKVTTPSGKGHAAVNLYSGSSYVPWNEALRANKSKTPPSGPWQQHTIDADGAFSPLPENVIVHRGTAFNEFALPDGSRKAHLPPPDPRELIGTVQTQHGYWSTSVGHRSAFFSKPVQMIIRLPAGHRAAYIRPISQYPSEMEMLVQRETMFFIHDVYQRDGMWWVEVEVLPEDADPQDYASTDPIPTADADKVIPKQFSGEYGGLH